MRRYLYPGMDAIGDIPVEDWDAVVIGSGIAGLYAALHIERSRRCCVVSKADVDLSNSWLAQGGIAAAVAPDDSPEQHMRDTLEAGAGLCAPEAVRVLVNEAPDNIRELIEMGVPFDLDADGGLAVSREGGHRRRRILHCGGDATGRETTKRLAQLARTRENIAFKLRTYLIDIVTDKSGHAVAALVCGADGKPALLRSDNIILASGGIGQLYTYTTNPAAAIGDGIAAAQRAGAELSMMEMVQFHPTTLPPGSSAERVFLISEAVRGEGAVLRSLDGEELMRGIHPMGSLAPRDIVTRAINAELERTGEKYVWLDATPMDEAFFEARFPTIFEWCRNLGINVPREYIKVRPAQHYFMGGAATDTDGRTTVPGLFACGECACTGIHGANRLASNSMLECLVFGRRAAQAVNRQLAGHAHPVDFAALVSGNYPSPALPPMEHGQLEQYRRQIKHLMSRNVGIVRHSAHLRAALEAFEQLGATLDNMRLDSAEFYELYNMAQIARDVAAGALARKESVGAHYIVD